MELRLAGAGRAVRRRGVDARQPDLDRTRRDAAVARPRPARGGAAQPRPRPGGGPAVRDRAALPRRRRAPDRGDPARRDGAGARLADRRGERASTPSTPRPRRSPALAAAGAPVERLTVLPPADPWFHPGRSGRLALGKAVLASFGELHPRVAGDLRLPVVVAELYLDALPPVAGEARPPGLRAAAAAAGHPRFRLRRRRRHAGRDAAPRRPRGRQGGDHRRRAVRPLRPRRRARQPRGDGDAAAARAQLHRRRDRRAVGRDRRRGGQGGGDPARLSRSDLAAGGTAVR